MQVRDAMSALVVTVGPAHTLRDAARAMSARHVGAAVVLDEDGGGPGIFTERDILDALAEGADPDVEVVEHHLTSDAVVADPGWSLEDAATTMVRGNFRHLVVTEAGQVIGVLSVRDVLRSGVAATV
jgi:CBS domain-containing protein